LHPPQPVQGIQSQGQKGQISSIESTSLVDRPQLNAPLRRSRRIRNDQLKSEGIDPIQSSEEERSPQRTAQKKQRHV
jgi:hypothetical protein